MGNPWAQFGRKPAVHGQRVVSAGSRNLFAPAQQNHLHHWFDLTDAGTVFADIAGLVPAGQGDPVLRITNKGFDPQDFINNVAAHNYEINSHRGLNSLLTTQSAGPSTSFTNPVSTVGWTFAVVFRRAAAPLPSFGSIFHYPIQNRLLDDSAGSIFPSVPFIGTGDAGTGFVDSLHPVVGDELVSVIMTGGTSGIFTMQVSGSPEVTAVFSPFVPIGAGTSMVFMSAIAGNWFEALVYNIQAANRLKADTFDYFDNKYGTLPLL